MNAPRKPRVDPIVRWIRNLNRQVSNAEFRIEVLREKIRSHHALIATLDQHTSASRRESKNRPKSIVGSEPSPTT